jgi:hypothetical protein
MGGFLPRKPIINTAANNRLMSRMIQLGMIVAAAKRMGISLMKEEISPQFSQVIELIKAMIKALISLLPTGSFQIFLNRFIESNYSLKPG